MPERATLWQMEREFWGGGPDVYRARVADEALMAFPGQVMTKDAVVDSIAVAPRWSEVRFEDQRAIELSENVVALVYRASARREGEREPYRPVVSSVYVRRSGRWLLALHQQTP